MVIVKYIMLPFALHFYDAHPQTDVHTHAQKLPAPSRRISWLT